MRLPVGTQVRLHDVTWMKNLLVGPRPPTSSLCLQRLAELKDFRRLVGYRLPHGLVSCVNRVITVVLPSSAGTVGRQGWPLGGKDEVGRRAD